MFASVFLTPVSATFAHTALALRPAQAGRPLLSRSGLALLLVLGAAWAVPAQAGDSGQASLAADALRVFLGKPPLAYAGNGASAALAVGGRSVVAVQRGDSLNAIIQRVFGPTAAQSAALRTAFVQLNPAAFVGNNPNRLLAGVVLQVPQSQDLGPQGLSGGRAGYSPVPASAPEDRRNWVRFP